MIFIVKVKNVLDTATIHQHLYRTKRHSSIPLGIFQRTLVAAVYLPRCMHTGALHGKGERLQQQQQCAARTRAAVARCSGQLDAVNPRSAACMCVYSRVSVYMCVYACGGWICATPASRRVRRVGLLLSFALLARSLGPQCASGRRANWPRATRRPAPRTHSPRLFCLSVSSRPSLSLSTSVSHPPLIPLFPSLSIFPSRVHENTCEVLLLGAWREDFRNTGCCWWEW